jgi:hypothetical protein
MQKEPNASGSRHEVNVNENFNLLMRCSEYFRYIDSRTHFSESLYTNRTKRIFSMLGDCYKCSHNGFRKRNRLCSGTAASISRFRNDVDDSTNKFDDLFPLYGVFIISC